MATTKKLSFGLDKAGGAALILARIGAALLWIIAALAAVAWVVSVSYTHLTLPTN